MPETKEARYKLKEETFITIRKLQIMYLESGVKLNHSAIVDRAVKFFYSIRLKKEEDSKNTN